jgi:hypothetical protein
MAQNPKFTFDSKSQRYRFKTGDRAGQFVSKAKVRSLIEKRITEERAAIDRLAANLVNDSIRLQDFEKGMAKRLKTLHIQSYILGRGDAGTFDNAVDKRLVEQALETQYQYLRGFTEAIRDGNLSEAQIRARAKSYARAAYGTQQRAAQRGHAETGRYQYERNVTSAGAGTCFDCEYLAFRGIVPIGTISFSQPPGSRLCRASCRCYMEYLIEDG